MKILEVNRVLSPSTVRYSPPHRRNYAPFFPAKRLLVCHTRNSQVKSMVDCGLEFHIECFTRLRQLHCTGIDGCGVGSAVIAVACGRLVPPQQKIGRAAVTVLHTRQAGRFVDVTGGASDAACHSLVQELVHKELRFWLDQRDGIRGNPIVQFDGVGLWKQKVGRPQPVPGGTQNGLLIGRELVATIIIPIVHDVHERIWKIVAGAPVGQGAVYWAANATSSWKGIEGPIAVVLALLFEGVFQSQPMTWKA